MKVVAKPIAVLAWSDSKGYLTPLRFKIEREDKSIGDVKIDKVISRNMEKLAGTPMYVYRCQSNVNDELKIYEIKYELNTCKWILFKV